jgi:hypothetical protein
MKRIVMFKKTNHRIAVIFINTILWLDCTKSASRDVALSIVVQTETKYM